MRMPWGGGEGGVVKTSAAYRPFSFSKTKTKQRFDFCHSVKVETTEHDRVER
jgi:hypothetical protein